jgi:hypothetical protein
MQNRPNDTQKIIGLSVALIVVVVIVILQLVRVIQGSGAAATPKPPVTTARPAASDVQVASAAATGPQAGPGQMRYFDPQLDTDPAPGQTPAMMTGNANAFLPVKAPATAKATQAAPPVRPSASPPGSRLPSVGQTHPVFSNPWASPGQVTQPSTKPTPPSVEYRLDGIVTGPDGFAMLTVRDSSVHDAQSAGQTIFKRVGDRIAAYRIDAISDSGITLRGRPQSWLVGQALLIGAGVIQEAPVSPVRAPASSGNAPAAPPSLTPAKDTLSPPTQTP